MSTSSKKESKKLTKANLQSFSRVFGYIKPYVFYFVIGMLLLVLSSSVFMVFPQAASEMLKAANGSSELPLKVSQYIFIFIGILLVQGSFSFLRTICFAIVSEKSMADLRRELFNKYLSLGISDYESRKIGELTSRITADVEKLQNTISITFAEFIRQFVMLFIGLIVIFWLAPKLSMIMLVTFPICVLAAFYFGRYIRKLSKARQDEIAHGNTVVEETMSAFQTVKAYTNEWYESIRYNKSLTEIVRISLKYARVRGSFFAFIIAVLFGGIFYILWRGALMVENGEMLSSDLMSFILYTGIIGGSIAGIGNLYSQLVGAVGATERLFEIMDLSPELGDISLGEKSFNRFQGSIVFDHVQFAYPSRSDIEVLKDISFRVEKGQQIALVGSSGAGKSTIAQLLMGFYHPSSGEIRIDGNRTSDMNPIELRKNIAIVPQDVVLFGTTIRENIRYGNQSATDDQIIEACKKAQAYDFIMSFPDGLETMVGERGVKLSGGQRQRVAIARALLKDPAILILDEATSSLDAESEHFVQRALDEVMKNRTSIIIAHRLSTIRDVDQIYVLDHGSIVESGTHDQLSSDPNSLYYNLAKLQMEVQQLN